MFNCPHCGNLTDLTAGAQRNMEAYGQQLILSTTCCQKGIIAAPVVSFRIRPYHGNDTEDAFGSEIKK